jgi:hypothetical protein
LKIQLINFAKKGPLPFVLKRGRYPLFSSKNTTATLLGTDSAGVVKLIITGGGTALISIIVAYQNPTPVSVASAANDAVFEMRYAA